MSNFPVLISTTDADWKDTNNGGFVGQSDGGDFIFTNSDGTWLPYEIEKYDNSAGRLVAWVKVDSISPTTDTYIYTFIMETQQYLISKIQVASGIVIMQESGI